MYQHSAFVRSAKMPVRIRARHACEPLLARRLYSGRSPSNLECESRVLPLPCANSRSHALEAFCLDRAEKLFPSKGLLLSLPAQRAEIRARHACEQVIHFRKQSEREMECIKRLRCGVRLAEWRLFYIVPRTPNASGCHQTNNRVTLRCRLRCLPVLFRRMKA